MLWYLGFVLGITQCEQKRTATCSHDCCGSRLSCSSPLASSRLNIIQFDNVPLRSVSLDLSCNSASCLYPIVCDYALFRHQLLGTTSLISRRVIRCICSGLLLASLFVFPSIILLHSVKDIGISQGEIRDYIFAGILVVSLVALST